MSQTDSTRKVAHSSRSTWTIWIVCARSLSGSAGRELAQSPRKREKDRDKHKKIVLPCKTIFANWNWLRHTETTYPNSFWLKATFHRDTDVRRRRSPDRFLGRSLDRRSNRCSNRCSRRISVESAGFWTNRSESTFFECVALRHLVRNENRIHTIYLTTERCVSLNSMKESSGLSKGVRRALRVHAGRAKFSGLVWSRRILVHKC